MDRKQEIEKELGKCRQMAYEASQQTKTLKEELAALLAPELISKYAGKCFKVTEWASDEYDDDKVFYIKCIGVKGDEIDYLKLVDMDSSRPILQRKQQTEEYVIGDKTKEITTAEFNKIMTAAFGVKINIE